MQNQISFPEPKIQVINGKLFTTSIDVAEFFGKRHDHVLRDIKKLIEEEPEFGLPNFGECEIIRDIPLQGEKLMPYYTMTRDGFVMLVMSYTGEKARKIKITYINAFNAMEAELFGNSEQLKLDTPSTPKDRKPITDMINILVGVAPFAHPAARTMLNAHLGVEHAEDITLGQIPVALAFLQEQINLYTAKPVEPPPIDIKAVLDLLREDTSPSRKELNSALDEYEKAGGKGNPLAGWDILFNMRKLYERVFDLALAAPYAMASLNRMEAEMYRNAAIILRIQKMVK